MSTPRGRRKRRFNVVHRCSFCNKTFYNKHQVSSHESSHDFFSCIHCINLLRSKSIALNRNVPPASSSSSISESDSTRTKPRLFSIDFNENKAIVIANANDASSNINNKDNNCNSRKRKHIELDSNSPQKELQPPMPKKPRLSSIKPADILNLVSEDEDDEESSLSSEFTDADITQKNETQPTESITNNKVIELASDSDVAIISAYDRNTDKTEEESDESSTDSSEDIAIVPLNDAKSKEKAESSSDSSEDAMIIDDNQARAPKEAQSHIIHASNGNDTTSTASNSSNDAIKSPSPHAIDWKQLDFEHRNPAHCQQSYYQNIHKNILSQLLHKDINEQIIADIIETRPNNTELKLKQFLIEFVVHKIGVLMKERKYFSAHVKKDMDYSRFVHLYGSLASRIDSAHCDVDIAINIPPFVEPKSFLRQLANVLEKHKIKQGKKFRVDRIFNAKVPILKLTDPLYNIEADISIYKAHDLAVKYINSLLSYNDDKRIRQLVIAVKHWSKKRRINCAMTGKINSFGFTILVLKYLQFLSQPVVPVMDCKRCKVTEKQVRNIVTSETHKEKCKNEALFKYYASSIGYHSLILSPIKQKKCVNDMSLSALLYGFFEFYANFDFSQYQISLNLSSLQMKQFHKFANCSLEQLTFVIEDPVDTTNNCARNVRQHTADLLTNEFRRAQIILLYGGDWMNDVCCDTKEQASCMDVVTLNTETMFYKQHERNQCSINQVLMQHIQQYVVDKAITSDDLYYGYFTQMQHKKKKQRKKNKYRRNMNKRYYLRRSSSF